MKKERKSNRNKEAKDEAGRESGNPKTQKEPGVPDEVRVVYSQEPNILDGQ